MKYLLSIICILSYIGISAQGDVTLHIEVSADTIYMDNAFRIAYKVENGSVKGFQQPDLSSFDLLQGPSRSSSMSIINGVQSSEEVYTYYFRPLKPGAFAIASFELSIDGESYKSNSVKVIVVPNPDSLFQDPNTGRIDGRPLPKKKSTKRKRFKI